MAHLAVPRTGWENEHLATFLLSRIAFVAHPLTVADDIGSDFFCTLFEPQDRDGRDVLLPINSFAIQVKSNPNNIPATNKIEYLFNLELPFFVGVVDRPNLRLAVYSGEYLPVMFSHLGRPGTLTMCPVTSREEVASEQYNGTPGGSCTLRLPHILTLSANDGHQDLVEKGRVLSQLCSRVHTNISSRKSNEYIFRLNASNQVMILAGPGSAETFRRNFLHRLAEVFYNLEWLLQNQPSDFRKAEFELHEHLYVNLRSLGYEMPDVLVRVYERLSTRVRESSLSSA